MSLKSRELLADVSLLGISVIWGVTFLMVQDAIKEVPVFAFLFWRFLLATVLFFLIGIALKPSFDLPSIRAGVILGVMFCLAFSLQTFGLEHSLSSVVGFITGLNVVFVPLFLWMLFSQKQTPFALLGIALAVVGLWMVSTNGGGIGLGKGELLTLGCAALFALHIVYTGIFSKRHRLFPLILAQFSTATLLCLLFSLLFDPFTIPSTLSYPFLKALFITALFATVLAFLVQTYMQRFTTPAKTAVIFTMEPVSAGIFGYFYAGEPLGSIQILGAGIIVLAMLSVELGSLLYRRKKRLN